MEWIKYSAVIVSFLSIAVSIYVVGTKRSEFNRIDEQSAVESMENINESVDIEIVDEASVMGYKALSFQGQDYENDAYVADGKIYISSDVIKNVYGLKAEYNVDLDKVFLSKPVTKSDEYVRYNIKDGEYYFYSSDIDFATFEEEIVSIAQLEEKNIFVTVNRRNTRSDNWEPAYVTDFVFSYNDLSYSVKGKPYVQLTVSEDYTVTRPDVDISNLTWRVVENGNVVLERNASGEYSYQYFGNQSGKHYEISLLGYFDGYEVISNIIEYDVK